MDYSNQLVRKILYTIFFILPVAASTRWLLKVLLVLVKRRILPVHKKTDKSEIAITVIVFVLFVLGLFLCFFMVLTMFFPSYELPLNVRIFGVILAMLFFGCIGVLYGLGRAVAAGAGSATGILNRLFRMISEDDKKSR